MLLCAAAAARRAGVEKLARLKRRTPAHKVNRPRALHSSLESRLKMCQICTARVSMLFAGLMNRRQ